MANLPMVKFAQYAPDISSLGTGVSSMVQNVFPRFDGYGPVPSIQQLTKSLPGPCRGYFFARKSDGSIAVFAGTANNLYLANNTDFSWTLVSKGGGSYGTVPPTDNWQFVQFNDTVIAVQVNTAPQKFALSTATAFVDLGGTPPNAGAVAIVGFFLVLTRLLANPKRVQWSDLSGIETWTAGVGLSDYQDLSDGGTCYSISGGDAYGVVFQDSAIRTFTYAPGSSTIFQILRIAADDGIFARYAMVNAGSVTYFLSPQGFKRIDPGGVPVPIGKGRVDDFFKQDVDTGQLQLIIGASDPTSTRIFFGYKSRQGFNSIIDKILIYDPTIGQGGSWSIIVGQSLEYLASLAKPGLTLESLDAIAPTPLSILSIASNGSGQCRLTMSAVANATFQIAGQNNITIYGAQGAPNINGVHTAANVRVIDSTHIDLLDVNYTAGYTGGGMIGGSIDAMTVSFDSLSASSLAQLSAITSAHAVGFFSGPSLEATLETEEQDSQGTLVFISEGIIPVTDCGTVMGSIGYRMTAQGAVTYTPESQVNLRGYCTMTIEARYARARLRFPAGASWTYARGIQPDVQAAGDT